MAADPPLRLNDHLAIPAGELAWRFSRSSGPGGQNVNTTDSRVELVFPLATTPSPPGPLRERALRRLAGQLVDGAVVIAASEHRSQWRNRQAAQQRLIELLRQAIAPPPPPRRRTSRPGVLWSGDCGARRCAPASKRGGRGGPPGRSRPLSPDQGRLAQRGSRPWQPAKALPAP